MAEQKLIFDLSNVYGGLYTSAFNFTLKVLYYNDHYGNLDPADHIYLISALVSSQKVSAFMSLPDQNGTDPVTLPQNVKSALVSIIASGNSAEELWYTNVPSEYVDHFPSNP